ncbi:MAG: hypothetical protein WC455_21500 [Dehalococcoidia bacterium]|jgi:hypothetical protein
MSTVLNFFKEHPSWDDGLHKILAKIPGYEAQLLPIRQQMLSCCGAEKSKSGEIKLTVADVPRWDALAAQEAAIMAKLQAIDAMVVEMDQIFAEIEAAEIEINRKTPAGIWGAAPRTDPPHSMVNGDYVNAHGRWCNRHGILLKSAIDPRFLAWAERAENAMQGL